MIQSEPKPGDQVMVTPEEISKQVPWKEAKSAIILLDMGPGKVNSIFLSTMSLDQMAWLSKQLDAHLTCLLGPMKEGF